MHSISKDKLLLHVLHFKLPSQLGYQNRLTSISEVKSNEAKFHDS